MKRIALVATDLSKNKGISSISLARCLDLSIVKEVFTISDSPFYPESKNITTHSGSIFSRLQSLKNLLDQTTSDYFLFTNWDSSIANRRNWKEAYLDSDFLTTPIWIEDNAFLMGSDNFNLSSRRFIESLIDILDKKNEKFLSENWSALTALKLQGEFLKKGILYSPHKSKEAFSYESGPLSHDYFGFSGSANFPIFYTQESLIPHANEIISRQTNAMTLLCYLKNCIERDMVDLFRVSVENFSEKPSLQNALRYELAINPSSQLPSVIEFFNKT